MNRYFQSFVPAFLYDMWLGYLYSPFVGEPDCSSEFLQIKLKKPDIPGIDNERW